MDWIVRTYDEQDNQISSFIIQNRTESQAEREAMHDTEVRSAEDWSMEEYNGMINPSDKSKINKKKLLTNNK